MRQKRYESVEKMLDLLDVAKRIGPKFPLDSMFLDPNDRKSKLPTSSNHNQILFRGRESSLEFPTPTGLSEETEIDNCFCDLMFTE